MANFIRNPIRRISTVTREARDVITAIGTRQSAKQDYKSGNPADRAITEPTLIGQIKTLIDN
jgi:hypothetical protein